MNVFSVIFIDFLGYLPTTTHNFTILSNYKKLKGIELFYNDGLNKVPNDIKKNPYLKTISIVGNKQLNYDDLFKKLIILRICSTSIFCLSSFLKIKKKFG